MKLRHLAASLTAAAIAVVLAAPTASASTTHKGTTQGTTGTRSLAAVLTAHGGGTFDRNWYDYDIVTQAVLAVLGAKPSSPVGALTDGTVALTAFLPNDRAFQILDNRLNGTTKRTEGAVFASLATNQGIDLIEAVLLYHVVPGATIDSKAASKANGAVLNTALPGASFKVRVLEQRIPLITLIDNAPAVGNPFVNPWALNINKGNKQIAHGITRVLLPIAV